ncbi:hypothetical protein PO124_30235 [Bacillus licheniformis]|nr:hypothetical protein [Bacillus licheniformis]
MITLETASRTLKRRAKSYIAQAISNGMRRKRSASTEERFPPL